MRRPCLLVLLALLGTHLPPAAAAPEDPQQPASPLRVFHAGALVMGRVSFLPRVVGTPREPGNEISPLYGSEYEEPWLPVGTLDEVAEALRTQVDPPSWEDVPGARLRPMGDQVLVVRQEQAALDGVGAALHRMEQRWLRPVLVDVVALRAPPDLEAQPGAERLAGLAGGEHVVSGASLVLLPEQRATMFVGRELAYLRDYDVHVAPKASISDPLVDVLHAGLAVDVVASPYASGRHVRLRIGTQHADLLRLETVNAGGEREVEQPLVSATRLHTTVEIPVGTWTLLEGSGSRGEARHVMLLVRARLAERQAREAGRGIPLPVLQSAAAGKPVDQAFGVTPLLATNPSAIARDLHLTLSNFTPPEPPELPEPTGAIFGDALVDLLREAIAPEAWGSRGGDITQVRDTLWVRGPSATVEAVGSMLTALERALIWGVEIEGRLVEVPAAAADGLLGVLAPEALAALEKGVAGGGAVLERVRVHSTCGQRTNVDARSERPYVFDYSGVIADDVAASNPDVAQLSSGVVLDVHPLLTSTRDAVVATVRLTRSVDEQAPRAVRTPAGEIRCPDMRVHELRADVELPFGRTVVAATWASSAARRTVLLLTARATGMAR